MSNPWENKVTLARTYDEAGTVPATADRLGCSPRTVRAWLKRHGIESNGPGRRPVWETTDPPTHVMENDDGYEIVETFVPEREDGEVVGHTRKHIKLHRLVAVAEWGIEQVKDAEIHHRDGMKLHNLPRNLTPLDPKRHGGLATTRRWDQSWVGDYSRGEPGP